MKLIDSVLLFGSLAFLLIWVNKYIYQKASFGETYFILMMAVSGFLYYVYRKGEDNLKKKKEEEEKKSKPKIENKQNKRNKK
jgi:high-affinity Fe2+/Pb2+ permease